MELQSKKCSFIEHEKIDANIYCRECNIYMCNKCEIFHSKLCKNHKTFILKKNNEVMFTGFCQEKKHNIILEYYCKNHNLLCCAACISKIKNKGNGKHKDCDICNIEDIKNEKLNKSKDNITLLEKLSNELDDSIKKLKIIFEKINENKEELKLKVQNIFTKIRNELNNREDKLLLEIDEEFNKNYFKEDIIKESEKLPNKIKISLETFHLSEAIDNNEIKDISIINDCINIENNINDINIINEKIKTQTFNDFEIIFKPDESEVINKFLESIKNFGKISLNKNAFSKSIIYNDINKQKQIINWIKEKINKDNITFELIFKMSENGTNSKDFHKFCDNKGPTLTLVKTTKNKIFGGFTPLNWDNKGGQLNDDSNQTFIFSLNLIKKYDMINKGGKGIYCSNKWGPDFGADDFGIKEDMNNGVTYANKNCNFLSNNNLELTDGKGSSENFNVDEIEVYKVLY